MFICSSLSFSVYFCTRFIRNMWQFVCTMAMLKARTYASIGFRMRPILQLNRTSNTSNSLSLSLVSDKMHCARCIDPLHMTTTAHMRSDRYFYFTNKCDTNLLFKHAVILFRCHLFVRWDALHYLALRFIVQMFHHYCYEHNISVCCRYLFCFINAIAVAVVVNIERGSVWLEQGPKEKKNARRTAFLLPINRGSQNQNANKWKIFYCNGLLCRCRTRRFSHLKIIIR